MSGEIEVKVGQIWQTKDIPGDIAGIKIRVVAVHELEISGVTAPYYDYVYLRDEDNYRGEQWYGMPDARFRRELEFVSETEELDPSKVKAGDTVTLENGETSVRGPVVNIEHHQDTVVGFAIKNIGWRYIADGVVAQQEDGSWLLTDHQPAPEPEPEWKPGTVAVATVRGVEGVRVVRTDNPHFPWASGATVKANWLHATSSVSDVRPLVVIDPAAAARKAMKDSGWGEYQTNVILRELGIEEPS